MHLRVSNNGRHFVKEDGTPFFYLADTAWELFHRLSLAEAEHYLRDRAAKRFTVIQAVVLAEYEGLTEPNVNGHVPLEAQDPGRPVEAYFKHVDAVVGKAAALGLVIGMLPTWGRYWNTKWSPGPEIFTPENAYTYGRFIGTRYAQAPLIWILGGDRPTETATHTEIIREMARGLKEGDGGANLMTFHPHGGHGSSEYFPDEPWLDFHMWQSGHHRNTDNHVLIASDYARTPAKPVLDSEPLYEDHPVGFDLNQGYSDDYDVRKGAYWALFAGACGHTYGCHPVWQAFDYRHTSINYARRPWHEAMHLPGAAQVQHARALLESRPYSERMADMSLVTSEHGEGTFRIRATRDERGRYALIYLPTGKPVTVDARALAGSMLIAHWFDPRTGAAERIGEMQRSEGLEFTPPHGGPDWILVLDAAKAGFPVPGAQVYRE